MLTCPRPECTVAQTGICVLNNDPLACPQRVGTDVQAPVVMDLSAITAAPLEGPSEHPRFPRSWSLGPDDVRLLTGDHYFFLAGILGSPRAGKTALLVSLYLLAASGKLLGYEFADSLTLMGIDEISRGARWWNQGRTPEEMTTHTEISDERTPGFLHLRLKRASDQKLLDLLLPDLPGEWSDALIDQKRTDRLSFMRSADVLWLTIDGKELRDARQHVLHRVQLMLQRIVSFLKPNLPKVLIVISHLDGGDPEARSVSAIKNEGSRLGLVLTIINVASFSDEAAIVPGTGLLNLLSATFGAGDSTPASIWPDTPRPTTGRYLSRFRIANEEGR